LVAFQGKAMAFSSLAIENTNKTGDSALIHEVARKVKKTEETDPVPPKRIFRNDKRKFKYKKFKRTR
jgi:hypothetical protein